MRHSVKRAGVIGFTVQAPSEVVETELLVKFPLQLASACYWPENVKGGWMRP